MSFVFVSHASPDKPAIRHIVDALIARGIKVWLDNPANMGYSTDEVRAQFYRLHADKPWSDEIDEAVKDAAVVLVCFSKRFDEQRREKWRTEAVNARYDGKLVACRIDDLNSSTLSHEFGRAQMPDLRATRSKAELSTALALLLDDIERRMVYGTSARLKAMQNARRDDFTPFLINRTAQEDAIGTALETVALDGGVRPFFIAGPENECLDEFVQRLQCHSCQSRLPGGVSWHKVVVEWPGEVSGSEFARVYQRRLAKELKLPATADEGAVVGRLAAQGRPVAVVSLRHASEWQTDEESRVVAWLDYWRRLAPQSPRFAGLPILCLKMPEAKPGWQGVPGGTAEGGIVSNARIWKAVYRLQQKPGLLSSMIWRPVQRPELGTPPLLHPVTRAHADRWLLDQTVAMQLGEDVQAAKHAIKELFTGRQAMRHGVTLADFAHGLKPLFKG